MFRHMKIHVMLKYVITSKIKMHLHPRIQTYLPHPFQMLSLLSEIRDDLIKKYMPYVITPEITVYITQKKKILLNIKIVF